MSFGRVITETNLRIKKKSGEVVRRSVHTKNHVVDQTSVAPDPKETAIINKYKPLSDSIGDRPVGQITADMLNAMPGMRCVAPRAAFYVLPSVTLPPGHTDEQFVLALLRETGILCVHGSGFGMPAEQGFFRIVFLADPQELASIYADIGAFTSRYLARG